MRKHMPQKEGDWWLLPLPSFHIGRGIHESLAAMDRRRDVCHSCGEIIKDPLDQDIGARRCSSCVEAINIIIAEYAKPEYDCPYE